MRIFLILLLWLWATPVLAFTSFPSYIAGSGCPFTPCSSTTLDGDGSTALVVCEQTTATTMADLTVSNAPTNFSFGNVGSGYTCGDKYFVIQGDGGYYQTGDLGSDYTELTVLIVYKYPSAEDAYQNFLSFFDITDGATVFGLDKSATDGNMVLKWQTAGDAEETYQITGLSAGWYVAEIHWKDAQADAGIELWHYALGSTRSQKDITGEDDSTLDVTGFDNVRLVGDADTADNANERVALGVLKIRSGATACPGTCCD